MGVLAHVLNLAFISHTNAQGSKRTKKLGDDLQPILGTLPGERAAVTIRGFEAYEPGLREDPNYL